MERRQDALPSREEFPVSSFEARKELDRILTDPEFHCAERNKKFLRFIAEEFFAGRANALKAYKIAVDVFGRPQNFDASIDPIVRIEATRLRAALVRYYEMNGNEHGIEIRLPKGHYIPEFVRAPHRRQDRQPLETSRSRVWHDLIGRLRLMTAFSAMPPAKSIVAGGALAVAAALVGAMLALRYDSVELTDKPTVLVELVLKEGPEDTHALAVRDSLMIALSRFNTLRLAEDAYTASASGRARSGGGRHGRYQILLKYGTEARSQSLLWQVVDRDSGETVGAGEESASVDYGAPNEADERLVSRLAVRLASMRGVINSIETARDLDAPSLGNGCVLRASLALTTDNPELLANARSCLERTLKHRPYDADTHATLAAVLLKSDPERTSIELANLAGDHAEEALALAPESDRSHMAEMMAAFRVGQMETARRAGQRAIALNPYNPAVAAKYSSILFAMGEWDEADQLARRALSIDDIPQPDAERTLAFDAYRRGAFDEAVRRLKQMPDTRCQLSQLLLAAALAQAGDRQEAVTALEAVKGMRPDFERTFQTDMASRHLTPILIEALGKGLRQAGSKIEPIPPGSY